MTANTHHQESFGRYAEAVARKFWGEPSSSKAKEMRFGSHGSKSVDLDKGTWYDHERGQGGGVLDLIVDRGEAANHPQAVRWLEQQGIHRAAEKPRARIVGSYAYTDADGVLVFEVCRFDPKDFRQRRPDASARDGWTWSVRGVQQVPYRLPQLLAQPGATVFVCEGEKDVDALRAAGLVATCNAGGAGKWPDSLTQHFAGRRVCVLPDNDDAGRAHAAMVAGKLRTVAEEVRILDLAQHWPDMPHKGDVSDWLAAGNDPAALPRLADAAPAAGETRPAVPAQADLADVHTMPAVPLMAWPHMSDKGQPLNTIPNLRHLLANYGFSVRYDVIRKEMCIAHPGQRGTPDNQRSKAVDTVISLCSLNRLPKADVPSFLLSIADDNPRNPVMDFIASEPWDGHSRFADLLATVSTRVDFDRDLFALLLRRWLISAVAAAAKPTGFWSKGVLVFQGEQSLGKTAWIRSLVPAPLRHLIKIDATINPDNKDSIISAVSHWIVELGELDGTLRKADVARLKGFISQDVDQFRRPYGRAEEKFQRRTVFFASVNPEQFLADDTGNVRWWTVPVVSVEYAHAIDMQQLWAEVFTWFNAGEPWWLAREEEARLERSNTGHQRADPIEELILSRYDTSQPATRRLMATEVLVELGYDKPNKAQLNEAGQALRKVFGDSVKSNGRKVFNVPSLRRIAQHGGTWTLDPTKDPAKDPDEKPF